MPDDHSHSPGPGALTLTHWGAYRVRSEDGRIAEVAPWGQDRDPSPIGRSLVDNDHPARVRRPAIRRGWLKHGPGHPDRPRGAEPFVEVPWDEALDLVAGEIARVRRAHGNEAIFGGSYGWASAGRFHHAQSQVHRFLKQAGGYVRSVDTYSHAALEVLVPHVLGHAYQTVQDRATSLSVVARETGMLVAFGGLPWKNTQIQNGGVGDHRIGDWLGQAAANGCRIVNISPIRDDATADWRADWLAIRPGADTALMLALAHTLVEDDLHDRDFLDRYTTGYERFAAYLMGRDDGQPKDADWAAARCDIEAGTIRDLARAMAASRTMINIAWSLQRADHGEQPMWMAITLAAMLGQIGLPGGGFTLGYGCSASIGNSVPRLKAPSFPQGGNPVRRYIPVARIADCLLNPGAAYRYNGKDLTYPDIRLVYWAGGNPFHHHQDLNRLVRAFQRPETVIVHEPAWTATARHADIVLPATTPLERSDIGGASSDRYLIAMDPVVDPVGEARDDHAIFADLAGRLGVGEAFTEGLDPEGWLDRLYAAYRRQSNRIPDYEAFRAAGFVKVTDDMAGPAEQVAFADFRADPAANKLPTPSGRIELYSETIAGFGQADCPGHPVWFEPAEALGTPLAARYPLHLLSNQPKTRLHSQWDFGAESREDKVEGREPARLNPSDAAARGIGDGDLIRLYNDRGACLAGARLDKAVRPGVIQLATGAWYDPVEPGGLCVHGNPNVLTPDRGTSALAQGPSAYSCLVEVERWQGEAPPITAHKPPAFAKRG
jgi:biotin/methionine sulfoxide reductase